MLNSIKSYSCLCAAIIYFLLFFFVNFVIHLVWRHFLKTLLFYFSYVYIAILSMLISPKYESNCSTQLKVIYVFVRLSSIFCHFFLVNFVLNLVVRHFFKTLLFIFSYIQIALLLMLISPNYESNCFPQSNVIHAFVRLPFLFCHNF